MVRQARNSLSHLAANVRCADAIPLKCIQSRGTPKCSTEEAFIETATFFMSLVSYQERRLVRRDAAREEIV